jgi:orotidine-5'-phosphate decarboxylase
VNTLVRQLGDAVWFYKLGLQLFMSGNYWDLVAQLVDAGKKVFVDLKFFDVPETVASAVRRMKDCGAELATIHGNDAMLAGRGAVPRDRAQAARGDRAHELRRGATCATSASARGDRRESSCCRARGARSSSAATA